MNIFEHLQGYISGNLKIVKTFLSLVKLEARLAGLSVYPLLLNICMLSVILMTTCTSVMVLLGYALFLFFKNYILAISLIVILNSILFAILVKNLKSNLNKISFAKTREIFLTSRQSEGNEPKQSIDERNYNDTKKILS